MSRLNDKTQMIAGLAAALTCLAAFGQPARAQTAAAPLGLEAAISEAAGRSPDVQRAKAVADEAGARRSEAFGLGFLPKVSASATHSFTNKFLVLPFAGGSFAEALPQTLLGVDLSVPIFDGLANVKRLEAANLNQTAASRELDFAEFSLSQRVRLAFYQAKAAELISGVYDRNVRTLEEHLRLVQLLFKNGAATNYDVLRVEVQLNEARSDALEARDNVELDRKKLAQTMGMDSDERALAGDLPVPTEQAIAGASSDPQAARRPDLEALDLRAQAMERAASADAAYLIPKISLAASYQYYNIIDRSLDGGNFADAYTVGAALTWNIWDGDVSRSRAAASAAQRTQAEKSSRIAKLQLPVDLEKWKRKYKSGLDRYKVRTLDVQKSRDEVALARQEQKAGARTSSEVLDAEIDLFKAQAGAVNAQLAAAEAYIQLELALGRHI